MLFAFSRDRAVPGHQLWRRVSSNRVPHMAVTAIVVAAAILMLPTLYNFFIGYYVGTGIAVIGLYIAFILPVILRYRMKDEFVPGAWTLGKHYRWIDPIAIVWVVFIAIVFLMPPYSVSAPWKDGFTWEAVNYAPALVGGALLLFGGWWLISAHKWFKGPGPPGHGGRARADRGAVRASGEPLPLLVPDRSTGAGLDGPRPSLLQHERARHVVVQRLPALRPERHQVPDRERRERA